MSIGIIGAGAAGLSAALALQNKGYKNITVLEKEANAGGKCRTFYYQGRSFELGAVIITHTCPKTFALLNKFGLKVKPISKNRAFFNLNGEEIDIISPSEKFKFIWQLFVQLPYIDFKYKKIIKPGLENVPSELTLPFEHFCKHNNLELFGKIANIACAAYGYGYFDEVPTAYYLKYLKFSFVLAILSQNSFIFADGSATIWKKIAEQFDVRYQQQIKRIERNGKIQIQTQAEVFEFDKIILACPLDDSLSFLNATPDEQELFSKIKHNKYYTFALIVENMPKRDKGYLPTNFSPDNRGHIMFWYRRYPDTDMYIFYVLANDRQEEQEIEKIMIEDLRKLGATIKQKYTSAKWKYFPHVEPVDMENKFYDRLESLQGVNGTYFVGELLNFSYIEGVVEYSYDLVKRFF